MGCLGTWETNGGCWLAGVEGCGATYGEWTTCEATECKWLDIFSSRGGVNEVVGQPWIEPMVCIGIALFQPSSLGATRGAGGTGMQMISVWLIGDCWGWGIRWGLSWSKMLITLVQSNCLNSC